MLFGLLDNPLAFLGFALALITGITVHECAHAFVALRLGDPTAKYQGRVTLNPLAHLDLFGTLLLFIAGFGWGKPVPVNPQYFARPVMDEILVALAGPASNFLLAAFIGGLIQLTNVSGTIASLGIVVMQINLLLMMFNVLPVPPLDGSKLLHAILDHDTYQMLQVYSLPLIILLLFILQSTGLGDWLSTSVVDLTQLLLGA